VSRHSLDAADHDAELRTEQERSSPPESERVSLVVHTTLPPGLGADEPERRGVGEKDRGSGGSGILSESLE